MTETQQIHGTCVRIGGCGVLLRGPSGSGKSDLALRLIVDGAQLVADDRTELGLRDDQLWASSPPALSGMLEVRGLGLMRLEAAPGAALHLLIDLVAPANVPRLPEPQWEVILNHKVSRIVLAPFESSAVAKVRLAARAVFDTNLCQSGAWTP
ncbi:HPr kinase/phosphatase C-terminal domain-containing protein [Magnetospira thiophila]